MLLLFCCDILRVWKDSLKVNRPSSYPFLLPGSQGYLFLCIVPEILCTFLWCVRWHYSVFVFISLYTNSIYTILQLTLHSVMYHGDCFIAVWKELLHLFFSGYIVVFSIDVPVNLLTGLLLMGMSLFQIFCCEQYCSKFLELQLLTHEGCAL